MNTSPRRPRSTPSKRSIAIIITAIAVVAVAIVTSGNEKDAEGAHAEAVAPLFPEATQGVVNLNSRTLVAGLAEAIAAAQPGDELDARGTHRVNLDIDKSITLHGRNATIAAADGSRPVITVRAERATLHHLRIVGPTGDAPGVLVNGFRLNLDHIDVEGGSTGIRIESAADIVVSNVTLREQTGAALLLQDASRTKLTSLTIATTRAPWSAEAVGISITGGRDVSIRNASISGFTLGVTTVDTLDADIQGLREALRNRPLAESDGTPQVLNLNRRLIHSTIADALRIAGDGDQLVLRGEFRANVRVEKNLTLEGEAARLQAEDPRLPALVLAGARGRLTNLSVGGSTAEAGTIAVLGAWTMDKLAVTGGTVGVRIDETHGVTIHSSEFRDQTTTAILVQDSTHFGIVNSTIDTTRAPWSTTSVGVSVTGGNNTTIEATTIRGFSRGHTFTGVTNATIRTSTETTRGPPTAGVDAPASHVLNLNRFMVYTNLRAAVDDAGPGDHLLIRGEHVENVRVETNLSLEGEGAQLRASDERLPALVLAAASGRLANLSVIGSTSEEGTIVVNGTWALEGLDVRGGSVGLRVNETRGTTIRGSSFRDQSISAIMIQDSIRNSVLDTSIETTRAAWSAESVGIAITGGSNVTIERTSIRGFALGHTTTRVDNGTFLDNTVVARPPPTPGIEAPASHVLNLNRFTIHTSIDAAVAAATAGDSLVIRGRFVENVVIGLNLSLEGEGASILPATHGEPALVLLGERGRLRNVTVSHGTSPEGLVHVRGSWALEKLTITHAEVGVVFDGVQWATLSRSSIDAVIGADVRASHGTLVERNSFRGADRAAPTFEAGVNVLSSSLTRIEHNTFAHSRYGIYVYRSNGTDIVANRASNHSHIAIEIELNSTNSTVAWNVVEDSTYGIVFFTSGNNSLAQGNVVSRAPVAAFHVFGGGSVLLDNNTVRDSATAYFVEKALRTAIQGGSESATEVFLRHQVKDQDAFDGPRSIVELRGIDSARLALAIEFEKPNADNVGHLRLSSDRPLPVWRMSANVTATYADGRVDLVWFGRDGGSIASLEPTDWRVQGAAEITAATGAPTLHVEARASEGAALVSVSPARVAVRIDGGSATVHEGAPLVLALVRGNHTYDLAEAPMSEAP